MSRQVARVKEGDDFTCAVEELLSETFHFQMEFMASDNLGRRRHPLAQAGLRLGAGLASRSAITRGARRWRAKSPVNSVGKSKQSPA
jgi:hypothetical protein